MESLLNVWSLKLIAGDLGWPLKVVTFTGYVWGVIWLVAAIFCHNDILSLWQSVNAYMMIGKGFYSKWVKSSFEQFITTQTRVGSTNGRIISQNTGILEFYFSTISGNLRSLWRHLTALFTLDVPLVSSFSAFIQQIVIKSRLIYLVRMLCSVHGTSEDSRALYCA